MRLALVHDYLAQDGGAERVLKAIHELWPEAPIFLLFHDRHKMPHFVAADIRESFLAKLPGGRSHYQWFLPWMPLATERLNLSDFDVVLSASSLFAKGVITHPGTLHISYCHTPPRFLWGGTHEYVDELNYGRLVKTFLPPIIHRLRLWDKMSADRVDHFIANSKTVQSRIAKYYRRDSHLLYPPTDTASFTPSLDIGNYFVAGGRLVPYKRLDLVVRAFNRLGHPLKIFGTGQELDQLRAMAKPHIEFLGRITDEDKAKLLAGAMAFIHPQLEDFGITPIESMAAGRPVIAYGEGGATETVIPGETGVLFPKQSWESLLDAVVHFEETAWDQNKIRAHAEKFDVTHFKNRLGQFVNDRYEEFKTGLRQPALIR
ncbi:MAG: glycosyltransferase family 4 protein [Candidatus Magasanikbacteria bacterium]|nr:glycosyltransferase family 4 protein [Candidatus Magasanikbacteria bacterium]